MIRTHKHLTKKLSFAIITLPQPIFSKMGLMIDHMNAINMIIQAGAYKNACPMYIYCHLSVHSSTKMKYFRGEVILTFLWMWVSLSATPCFSQLQPQPPQGQQVPCFFIFGDSLVDNGNNNAILTLARANYRPYGIDFPQGATGRFTNGRTYVDALGIFYINKLVSVYI